MKNRLGLVLVMALGFALTGCAGGGTSQAGPVAVPTGAGGEVLAQGERPRQNDNTRAAQRALDQADEAEGEAEAMALYEEALTAAQAAITADPTNPLPHRQAAMALMGLERWQEAGEAMTRAEELRPIYQFETEPIRERAWIALYQEAVPLVNAGDYEAAAQVFRNANAIYSARPEAMFTLGQIYGQLRQHDAALDQLATAVAIVEDEDRRLTMDSTTLANWDEQAGQVPVMRAQILADAGRFEEAVVDFRALYAADPDDIMIARNLAAILVQMGSTEEAFEVYAGLMERPELSSQEFYAIGIGFYQGDDYNRASQAFGEAAQRSVMDRDAVEMWARSLQLDSAFTAIPPVAERWVELDPYSQNGMLILAQAVNMAGDEDRARELIMAIEALQVQVNNLTITRLGGGGATVTGSLTNKTLAEGTSVILTFNFYAEDGTELGTAQTMVTAGGEGMAEMFQVNFASSEYVGGYGYDATIS
jgi:tetratricopeptide (TPR) repeat protein